MNEIRPLLYFILGLLIMFEVFYEVSKSSPCSVWSDHPSDCSPYTENFNL